MEKLGRRSNLLLSKLGRLCREQCNLTSLGYYIHCDLFEWCNQEQLIYLFGISQAFQNTFKWVTKDIDLSNENINFQIRNYFQNKQ